MILPSSTNQHAITQYNHDRKSIFNTSADQETIKWQEVEGCGAVQTVYGVDHFPPNLGGNASDIETSLQVRREGPSTGRITIDGGLVAEILHLQPSGASPMHRTRTLDLVMVVEGEVELELDGADKRLFKAGDSVVLRGAGHRWVNVSKDDGWAKLFSATIDAAPIVIGGSTLEETWDL